MAPLLLAALTAGSSCASPVEPPAPSDRDGDGWEDSEDCAPDDPSVHPGAAEACDGLDVDCDPDPLDVDQDGDGVALCADDCDDTDGTRFPGNTDVCDGRDTDCVDGPVEGDVDADGDGVPLCAGDCLDSNAAVHPGAVEVCDGWDNDCDGVRDDVPSGVPFPTQDGPVEPHIAALLVGEVVGDRAGRWATGVGDVNGDGYGDIAIGTDSQVRASRVHVVHGPICGEATLALAPEGASNAVIVGLQGDLQYIGDVSGDGIDDLKVGNRVFYGPLAGEIDPGSADLVFTGIQSFGWARYPMVFGADFNGDGTNDVAVADARLPEGWSDPDHGQVHVFLGPIETGVHETTSADFVVTHNDSTWGGSFGTSVASPGDLDGNGSDELLVGAPGWTDVLSSTPDNREKGAAYLFMGPLEGRSSSTAEVKIYGTEGSSRTGWVVAGVGDVDGDGQLEYTVSSPGAGGEPPPPTVAVYGQQAGSLLLADAEWVSPPGTSNWSYAGAGVSGLSDLNGDGRTDWVFTSQGDTNETFGLFGTVSLVFGEADIVKLETGNFSPKGEVGTRSDINGDGVADVVLGAVGYEQGIGWTGGAIVLHGDPGEP